MTTQTETQTRRRTFKMPTVYTLLFIITALVVLMTWFVPAGKYDYLTADTQQLIKAKDVASYSGGERLLPVPGSYTELTSNPQGIGALLEAPLTGFGEASSIILFVLMIGGFLNVTIRTGAMDASVAAMSQRFAGREQWLIPILIFILAVGGSTYGMSEETVSLWVILLPLFIAAGYDRLVVAGIILLGSGIGVATSTVNPFATGVASRFAEIPLGDGIVLRLASFAIFYLITCVFIMRYAAKVKADPSASLLSDINFDDKFSKQPEVEEYTTQHKLTMTVFFGAFGLMIYGVIPWEDIGVTFVPALNWWLKELSVIYLTAALIIGLINRMPEGEFVKAFISGCKDMIGVVLVIAVAKGINVVMNDANITDTILSWAEGLVVGLNSGVFAVVSYVAHILLAFFIPSSSGLATVSMPLMGPISDLANVDRNIVVTAYQMGSGWINLFAPTAATVVAGLAIANIPYGRFLKWVVPYIGAIFLGSCIVLFIAA
ncbi:TIGR00366 family protein [Vibrio sp. SCSIO 43136]|uniref:YfcC family protein n=1 Tax=Vibrio sp. SCSIO 43136 TaxID=2819101 RepID=UPI00207553F8|nr:TIGR00366 family protein [Vibrio sp. SCSIO 43136]USD68175.1 YfcC family protein [Vibrio sp. SCSIO 43136]